MITKDGKTIVLQRTFHTSAERVFAAWSNPQIFKTWWKEISVAEMDFREGGSYKLMWDKPCSPTKGEGESAVVGTYKQIIPNKKIQFTWNGTGEWSANQGNLITITLTAQGTNKTELELKHEFSPTEEGRDSHHEGWTFAMISLDEYINAPQRKINEHLKVNVSKTISAPVEKVFAAWTDSKSLAKWFNRDGASKGTAHTEGKAGTTFSLDYQLEDGRIHRIYGTYSEVIPNQKLSFSWIESSNLDRKDGDFGYPTHVTVLFKDLGDGQTRIDLTHFKLSSEASAKNFQGGWTACLNGVEKFLLG